MKFVLESETNKDKYTEISPPLLLIPPYIQYLCARAMPEPKMKNVSKRFDQLITVSHKKDDKCKASMLPLNDVGSDHRIIIHRGAKPSRLL